MKKLRGGLLRPQPLRKALQLLQDGPEGGIPESFKVLLKELQSLALDVTVLDENGNEVKLAESVDYSMDNANNAWSEGNDYNNGLEGNVEDSGFSTVEGEEIDEYYEDDFGSDSEFDGYSEDSYTFDDPSDSNE